MTPGLQHSGTPGLRHSGTPHTGTPHSAFSTKPLLIRVFLGHGTAKYNSHQRHHEEITELADVAGRFQILTQQSEKTLNYWSGEHCIN